MEILLGDINDFPLHESVIYKNKFESFHGNDSNGEFVVYRMENRVFMFENMCSHEKYPLQDGIVQEDSESIICIHHGAQFDLNTGSVQSLPATRPIKVLKTLVRDGKLYAIDK
ncbi:MAG: Rieske (2Fe-2S) protein [Patescibacteria group bacterium]